MAINALTQTALRRTKRATPDAPWMALPPPHERRRGARTLPAPDASGVTNPLDDAAATRLSDRLVRGDSAALATLYEARFEWMLLMIRHATRRDESFALDCVQDAWMRVARAPVRCSSAAALDGWLRRVALSAALDRVRSDTARRLREMTAVTGQGRVSGGLDERLRRRSDARDAATELLTALDSIESLNAALSAALDRCGSDDRGLLIMRFRAGMTLAQIGSVCGLGAAAVDSRLRRLLARLRASLHDEEAVR